MSIAVFKTETGSGVRRPTSKGARPAATYSGSRAAETTAVDLAFERAGALLSSAEIVARRLGDRSVEDDLDAANVELAIQRGDSATAVSTAASNAILPLR